MLSCIISFSFTHILKKGEKMTNSFKLLQKTLPVAVLVAGVIMMMVGLLRGELQEILHRGIVICLECIGIG